MGRQVNASIIMAICGFLLIGFIFFIVYGSPIPVISINQYNESATVNITDKWFDQSSQIYTVRDGDNAYSVSESDWKNLTVGKTYGVVLGHLDAQLGNRIGNSTRISEIVNEGKP